MQDQILQHHIDFLLSMAIRKCGNISDAQDLTQDTILAALACCAKGGVIEDLEAWLIVVMNRKYYDMLRRKYHLATTTIKEGFDIADERDHMDDYLRREEAEMVRREVAHLSETYRTIIARHYFHGESVAAIAEKLHLPEGTVKSRLSYGRRQLKKGFETMEKYTENSYAPQRLIVRNSGRCGLKEEPMSLVPEDDPLPQNILILAYEKPVSISELSKTIGVSAAYVEPVVNKLVNGELMKRMGDGKVYTDFIIYPKGDFSDAGRLAENEQFAAEHADAYCVPMEQAIHKLQQTSFYSRRLERYMLINIAECILWKSLEASRNPQVFPDRPNGGKWIAFGTLYPAGTEDSDIAELEASDSPKVKYMLCGQRETVLEQYLDSTSLKIYNYETNLYPYPKISGFGYDTFQEAESNMLKLFYLISKRKSPETVDADPRILKAMPLLEERGFIRTGNGEPELLIPCLTQSQAAQFWKICGEAAKEAVSKLSGPLAEYMGTRKKKIPSHLKSVPDAKLTMPYEPHAMMLVGEAIKRGLHPQDLGYPCPETFVVFD